MSHCPHCAVTELYALRLAHHSIVERDLDNRLAVQSLKSAIITVQDELADHLNGLDAGALSDFLERVEAHYDETARIEFEQLAQAGRGSPPLN